MLAGSSLGNSVERALGTHNPCHRQYTSNSHLFSYRVDHGGFATINSIVVVPILSFVGLPTMIYLTLPRLSYMYIGILRKSLFFPIHFPPQFHKLQFQEKWYFPISFRNSVFFSTNFENGGIWPFRPRTLVFLFNFAAQIVVFFYYKINNLLLKWNWFRNLRQQIVCLYFYCSGCIVWSLLKWNWFETLNGQLLKFYKISLLQCELQH